MGYWEKKYKEKEKQEQFNEQMNGCMALILLVVGLVIIRFIEVNPPC